MLRDLMPFMSRVKRIIEILGVGNLMKMMKLMKMEIVMGLFEFYNSNRMILILIV